MVARANRGAPVRVPEPNPGPGADVSRIRPVFQRAGQRVPVCMALVALVPLVVATELAGQDDIAGAIAAAFGDASIVAIGENHGHVEFHALLISLLEDPRVQRRVDDIAVEFGNALYQDVMDRFVAGEAVPRDSVRMAWRNSIVSPNRVWDSPVYEAFFDAVRRINGTRSDGRSYRVVLADSPVDWGRVGSREDLRPFYDRPAHIAAAVSREVLERGRRGLLVAGGAHLTRVNMVLGSADRPAEERNVASRIAGAHPEARLHLVRSLGRAGDADLSPVAPAEGPVLLPTGDPRLADLDANRISTMRNMDGTPFRGYGDATLADLVDAVIVWGEGQTTFAEPPEPDPAYRAELDRRLEIVRG